MLVEPLTRSVGAYEAKTRLAELLDAVAGGERVIITRHGVPVAMLTQPGRAAPDVPTLIAAARELRAAVRATPCELREWIAEGRR